jgi:hypothetical protein
MPEVDTATDCIHMTIDFEPRVCEAGHGVHQHWICRDCDEEFLPATLVEGLAEAVENANRVAAHFFAKLVHTRVAAVCVGLVTVGAALGRWRR